MAPKSRPRSHYYRYCRASTGGEYCFRSIEKNVPHDMIVESNWRGQQTRSFKALR